MRFLLPLTGTLLTDQEGGSGDPADPVRMITLDLGDVSWRVIRFYWENDFVEIELEPSPRYVDRVDPRTGLPIPDETEAEYHSRRIAALSHVRSLLIDKTKDELYDMTGAARLKRPFKGEP